MPVIRSLCSQCGMGCGIRAVTGEGREVTIAGDPVHPANGGLLCDRSHALISNPAYEELTPWRWGEVPFDEGRFPTPEGKARLVPSWI